MGVVIVKLASQLALEHEDFEVVRGETIAILRDAVPTGWFAEEIEKLRYIKDRMELKQALEADYEPRYTFKSETIIRWLSITPEEQQHMKTIIDEEEHKRRRRVKNGWVSQEEKKEKTQENMQKAKDMKQQGWNNREIAESLRIDRRTVRRYLSDRV